MEFRRIKHRGLRRLIEANAPEGLPPAYLDKIGKMLSFLQEMEGVEELRAIPIWRAHHMSGDRRGTWSLVVSRNWRITFRIDEAEKAIVDLDFEDYH